MIHCDRCKTVNPPNQLRCQKCNRDLLPGMGVWVRIFILVFCLLIAAFAAWVVYKMATGAKMPDLGCAFTSPIWWALLAVVMPIGGLVSALKRTPMYERYFDRAKRHLTLDKDQALADLNKAVELAPEKNRVPILKERAKLLESMGNVQQATRDKIASLENEGRYENTGAFAAMIGADKDIYVNNVKKADREALLKTSHAIALGYCPKCKAAVGLDEKSHCKLHPHAHITDIRLAVPRDIETVKQSMLEERAKKKKAGTINTLVTIAALIGLCVILVVVFNIISK